MKTKLYQYLSNSLIISLSIFVFSCSEDITERNENFQALNPTNIDANGGTWKPILLTAPDEFTIDVPIATNTPAYTREINEIKSYQAAITEEQKNYYVLASRQRFTLE